MKKVAAAFLSQSAFRNPKSEIDKMVVSWKSPFSTLPCPNCGHACAEGSTLCPHCGAALRNEEAEASATPPPLSPARRRTLLFIVRFCSASVGLPLLLWSLYLGIGNLTMLTSAERATGTVYEVSSSAGKSSNRFPRVRFRTAAGQDIEITGNAFSSYTKGDQVEVLYYPATPKEARINSFIQLWALPQILFLPGAFFTFVAFGPTEKISRGLARLFGAKVK